MDAYKLKWIAIIGMVLSHVVIAWWEIIPIPLAVPLAMAGGLTFPIMAYFVVEGYRYTSNVRRYVFRMFVFGVISIPFHILTFRMFAFNIMFTLIVGVLCLILYDKIKIRPLFWLLFIFISLLTMVPVMFDWSVIGVIVILLFHIIRNEKSRRIIPPIVAGVYMTALTLFMAWTFTHPYIEVHMATYDFELSLASTAALGGFIASAVLLMKFNGERGKRMKWFFYAFYPAHLAILGIVSLALGLVDFSVFGF